MESTDSSSVPPQLPPGYRFHPTDEELVVHYLKKKIASDPLPVSIITEIDLYKFDPWELPGKASFGDQEWYFFSPRDRKYPNGARPNRAATSGYWKATGTDKPILIGGGTQKIAVKKALVFYSGKPPKGIKTNWIMHEYRLLENSGVMKPPGTKKNSSRLDDWVLCRIYKKNNSQRSIEIDREAVSMDSGQQQTLTRSNNGGFFMENNETTIFDGLLHDSTSGHLHTSLKRNLPAQYWNETVGSESSEKRFQTSTGSNSVANLLNQIPQQSSSFNQQMLLGSLGDGVYRQQQYHVPGINWNP